MDSSSHQQGGDWTTFENAEDLELNIDGGIIGAEDEISIPDHDDDDDSNALFLAPDSSAIEGEEDEVAAAAAAPPPRSSKLKYVLLAVLIVAIVLGVTLGITLPNRGGNNSASESAATGIDESRDIVDDTNDASDAAGDNSTVPLSNNTTTQSPDNATALEPSAAPLGGVTASPVAIDPNATDSNGTDQNGSNSDPTDPNGNNDSSGNGSNAADTNATDPNGTDSNGTDSNGTGEGSNATVVSPGAPVTVPISTDAPVSQATNAPVAATTEAPVIVQLTNSPVAAPVAQPTDPPVAAATSAPVVPATDAPVVPATPAPVVPATDAPVVPATPAPVVPATPAPVVPATDAPVVPATPAPIVPATPAPIVPATPAPIVPATDAPVVPATPAPVVVVAEPTDPPVSEASLIKSLLQPFLPIGNEFDDATSYQSKALTYVQTTIPPQTAGEYKVYFALASIYYASSGVSNKRTIAAFGDAQQPLLRGWISSGNWVSGLNYCSWHGISCNPADGSITHIELPQNRMYGIFAPEVRLLKDSLQVIDLFSNNFLVTEGDAGNSWIAEMTHLRHLFFGTTSFEYAGIPSFIGQLPVLEEIDFSNTYYSFGPIREGAFANNPMLTYVTLSRNTYTSTIPSAITNHPGIEYLYLADTTFEGVTQTLDFLVGMPSLQETWNDFTEFEGSLPTGLGSLSTLMSLSLSFCTLTGTIPTELGNLGFGMSNLWLHQNALTGSIPTELANLSRIKYLHLEGNSLSGAVPESVCSLRSPNALLEFMGSDCQADGTIECSCCTCCGPVACGDYD